MKFPSGLISISGIPFLLLRLLSVKKKKSQNTTNDTHRVHLQAPLSS